MARRPRIMLIDNYDSFTWNLVHLIGAEDVDVAVHRNDKIAVEEVVEANPDAIVLSPGPCTPNEAGICLDLINTVGDVIPMLGVCLGHQAMGQAFGGKVVRAPTPMHGKVARISHKGTGLFRGINGPVNATRYHSLVVERDGLPKDVVVSAESDDGLIMGLHHAVKPCHGVQFHPESIASEHGISMVRNFLALAGAWNKTTGRRVS